MLTYKNVTIILFALLAFISGCISQYFEPGDPFSQTFYVSMFLSIIPVFAWYHFDSTEMQFKRSAFLNIGVIAVTLIALPYYFIKSRGVKIGILYSFGYLAICILWGLLQTGGTYAVYYGLQS